MNRVVVGISGGVDSSVAALLLQKEGYEVVGITFMFVDNMDTNDAAKVCEKLNIEHHIVDYRKEFKEKIIDNFIKDYRNGLTPNPCVLCNKNVKIKLLYEWMKKLNCDYIATGHYAKSIDGGLFISSDLKKDQTYFLCQVPGEIISKLKFPLEGITKDVVRQIALENNLITADKKDSTDVCFINNKFREYMNNEVLPIPGDVINVDTLEKVGSHKGLAFYTIGQRKGLDIGGNKDKMFVVGKNIKRNILYVAFGADNEYLISDSCVVKNINFNTDLRPNRVTAKFRYGQSSIDVNLEYIDDDTIIVRYDNVKSVTPGQACVFYFGDACIGGGIITEVRKNNKKLWYLL